MNDIESRIAAILDELSNGAIHPQTTREWAAAIVTELGTDLVRGALKRLTP